jgi:hypothetical protein
LVSLHYLSNTENLRKTIEKPEQSRLSPYPSVTICLGRGPLGNRFGDPGRNRSFAVMFLDSKSGMISLGVSFCCSSLLPTLFYPPFLAGDDYLTTLYLFESAVFAPIFPFEL